MAKTKRVPSTPGQHLAASFQADQEVISAMDRGAERNQANRELTERTVQAIGEMSGDEKLSVTVRFGNVTPEQLQAIFAVAQPARVVSVASGVTSFAGVLDAEILECATKFDAGLGLTGATLRAAFVKTHPDRWAAMVNGGEEKTACMKFSAAAQGLVKRGLLTYVDRHYHVA